MINITYQHERWYDIDDLPNETWKDLCFETNNEQHNYMGLYMISNYGRIKSLTRNIDSQQKIIYERILKPVKAGRGYLKVCLSNNGVVKQFNIHKLVALVFIPNEEDGLIVDHIDCNRTNNKVTNLRWCTYRENSCHTRRHKIIITVNGKQKLITQYKRGGEIVGVYPSCADASRKTGFSHSFICRACKNENFTTGSYRWGYITVYYYNLLPTNYTIIKNAIIT